MGIPATALTESWITVGKSIARPWAFGAAESAGVAAVGALAREAGTVMMVRPWTGGMASVGTLSAKTPVAMRDAHHIGEARTALVSLLDGGAAGEGVAESARHLAGFSTALGAADDVAHAQPALSEAIRAATSTSDVLAAHLREVAPALPSTLADFNQPALHVNAQRGLAQLSESFGRVFDRFGDAFRSGAFPK